MCGSSFPVLLQWRLANPVPLQGRRSLMQQCELYWCILHCGTPQGCINPHADLVWLVTVRTTWTNQDTLGCLAFWHQSPHSQLAPQQA